MKNHSKSNSRDSSKIGLITGISGQDGSYLAELLLAKGYRVIGIDKNLDKAPDFVSLYAGSIEMIHLDIQNQPEMEAVLSRFKPSEIYNYAAYSSGEGMFDDPAAIAEVNGVAVTRILQAIRQVDKNIRFCQASSSEMFGQSPLESPQSERTPFQPRSPYGAAKLYAHSMIQIYRQRYGLFACSAILFNHESPRRGLGFVTRKISQEAVKIKLGLASELLLGNLDVRRDWGFAGDYVRAMWLMLQQSNAYDYVIATGQTHSVKELCEIVFGYLGMDYRDYVREDAAVWRPPESVQLVGDFSKAREQLGWAPEVEFKQMVKMMVDADLRQYAEKNKVKGNE